MAFGSHQWHPRIKSNIWLTRDQWIVGKIGIGMGIFNDQQIGLMERMSAKGQITRGFIDGQAHFGFKPLPMLIDQTNQHDRHIKLGSQQLCDVIKASFSGGV